MLQLGELPNVLRRRAEGKALAEHHCNGISSRSDILRAMLRVIRILQRSARVPCLRWVEQSLPVQMLPSVSCEKAA